MSELQEATVTKFTQEQGFGTISVADGTEYSFDYAMCTFEPSEGDRVLVKLGPSRLGGLKVVHMEPGDDD